jgi:GNAT superfamily N-acetyltransferase
MYEVLEQRGMAQCFAAYDGEVLRGCAFVVMAELPHYGRARKFATVESLFVARAARGTGMGRYLMDAVESYCRSTGCAVLFYSAPAGSRLARLLFLNSDRYTNTNHVFCRSLA